MVVALSDAFALQCQIGGTALEPRQMNDVLSRLTERELGLLPGSLS